MTKRHPIMLDQQEIGMSDDFEAGTLFWLVHQLRLGDEEK